MRGRAKQVKGLAVRRWELPAGYDAALIGQVGAMPGSVARLTFGAPAFLAFQRS